MIDMYNQKILCNECDIQTKKNIISKDGYQIRILECPNCSKIIYHPRDIKEYEDFKKLKSRDFNVKLRMVGNSFCVSVPKELIDFHREMENEINDMVRLSLEGPGKIGMFFVSKKIYRK